MEGRDSSGTRSLQYVSIPYVRAQLTPLQNWAYIKECVETLHASAEEKGLPAPPMFGNGDCFSAQQYYEEMEASGVDGIMVARGALIKPWIFTEIKERREWDISATERLEGIRKVRHHLRKAYHRVGLIVCSTPSLR